MGGASTVTVRRRVVAWAATVAVAAGSLVAVAETPAGASPVFVTPTRIMPLGDSITWGSGGGTAEEGGGGYRTPLVQAMVEARYTSDMVGSVRSGQSFLYDRDHEGVPGDRIDQVTDRATARLRSHLPDFVLLMVGSNDVVQQHDLAGAPGRLSDLIDLIVMERPSAHLVVASIPPLADPDLDRDVQAYNAAIPDIVAAKAAAGKQVSFIDMYSLLTVADLTSDGIHPHQGGYDKMAAAWEARLAELRPTPTPISERQCPCSIWDAGDRPAQASVSSMTAAEVGVKFRLERDGVVTGIRFYKGTGNTGTHVGTLWKATGGSQGDPLARATFTNETSSGWQQVTFAQPVPVRAHELYFATYYAPNGRYAADPGYFTDREVVSSPLRAPSQGSINGNGFVNSGGPGLPVWPTPANGTNYWVDVVFVPSGDSDPAPPDAPTTVTATAVSSERIDVSWSAADGATGYRVERSLDGSAWATLVNTASTSHSDTGLEPETTYHYRVVATNDGGASAPSPVATATTPSAPAPPADETPPTAPERLKANGAKAKVNLSWWSSTDEGGSGLAGYNIWRSTSGESGPFQLLATSSNTSFSDDTVASRATYWYRVTAFDGAGNESPPSDTVSVRPK